MKNKKIIFVMLIFIVVLSLTSICYAKYVFDYVKKAVEIEIDRTSPILKIEYSITEPTNTEVEVKILANEKIQNVEGWQLLEDEKTLVKVYTNNIDEIISIKDLSGNQSEANVVISNIDKTQPIAEIIEIDNTNVGYEKYANMTHEILLKIKISDTNKIINNLKDFEILVGTKENVYTKEIEVIEKNENYIIYQIKLSSITENGQLIVKIPQNSFEDVVGNKLEEIILDTGILIDNISPEVQFSQNKQENGKVIAIITSNEQIRNINGWESDESQKVSSKEFISDIKYHRSITDLAGNVTNLEIKVEDATFLGLDIRAHMSTSAWTNSQINDNTVGRMEKGNFEYKFESLLFRTSKNVDGDFLKVAGYVYSYWGPNSYAKSGQFGAIYNYGYNPIEGYKTMNNTELVQYENNEYIHLGGEGINYHGATDINGNNPIPNEIAAQYRYGITGIKLDLKQHDENSIIYQIFFNDTGWLKTCKNGEEAMKSQDKPIEAMKFTVVPTSEMEFVIQEWDKNIGTYNLE